MQTIKITNWEIFLKDFMNRRDLIELRKILLKNINMWNFDWNIKSLDYDTYEKYKEKAKEILIEKIWLNEREIFNKQEILDYIYDTNNVNDTEYLDLEKQIDLIINWKKK